MSLSSNPYGPYISDKIPESIPPGEVALFVPKYNSKRHDATGAFHPEAINFCKRWNIPRDNIHYIDNKLPKSVHRPGNIADALLDEMEEVQAAAEKPIAIWIFLCHGYTHGIQFSIRSPGHRHFDPEYKKRYDRFLDIIGDHSSPLLIMYACSTSNDPNGEKDTAPGSGDGSWADYVRDDLCKKGAVFCRVFTHATAGPATTNPFIKLIDGEGVAEGGVGGQLLAAPRTTELVNLRALLQTDFRFEVPFLTFSVIQDKIS